jgi:hypothetical protein
MNSTRWSSTVPRLMVALSVTLYGVSLTQNTFCVSDGCDKWLGWGVLLMGWIEPVAIRQVGPFVALSWLANPCVGVAWVCAFTGNRLLAIMFGGAGVLFGFGFLLGKFVLVSESGSGYRITGYAGGYWIWIASLTLALGAAILSRTRTGSRGERMK